jgi:glyoxylase-like metal-dependent hydrolase (beta-lactamase superfamily II)
MVQRHDEFPAVVSRREALFAGAAVLAAAAAPGVAGVKVGAAGAGQRAGGAQPGSDGRAASKATDPVGYRFTVGELECLSIPDSVFQVPPKPLWAPEASEAEVKAALRDEFLPEDVLTVYVNILVVRSGKETVLIDTGNGVGAGLLLPRLSAAGIEPSSVTGVIITHMHGDHVGGLTTNGTPTFPNAAVYTNVVERDFWLKATPDDLKNGFPADRKQGFIDGARKAIDGAGKALQVVKSGDTLMGGLTLVGLPGHTPGHVGVRVMSGKDSLLHFADTAHHQAIMVPRPEWSVMFDTDSAAAIETRKKLFAQAASERTRLYSYHLPWPGIGHLRAQGAGYRWVAEPWMMG